MKNYLPIADRIAKEIISDMINRILTKRRMKIYSVVN